MKTTLITLSATALLLGACGNKDADKTAAEAGETAVANETASVPVIGEMQHTPDTLDSFCSFQRKGQPFDYHDHSTWRFVFTDEIGDPEGTAYVMLDGVKRTIKPVFENSEGGVTVYHYETVDEPKTKILLEIAELESQYEVILYEGIIGVIKSVDENDMPTLYDESVIMLHGDCGT